MKGRLTIVFLTALISTGALHAQDFDKARLDSLFDLLAIHNRAMGSVVLSKNGEIIYRKAIGYTLIDGPKKLPATPYTTYRIGSVTKMFTAVMIFQLIEEGKLSLATTLDKYYPQFPNSDRITIEHMLRHRSGLYNFTSDPGYIVWNTTPKTEHEMLYGMSYYPAVFQPDEKFEYSNTNYVLLGYILKRITRKSYSENLEKRITSRIDLKSTYYGGKTDAKKGEAQSYQFMNAWQATPVTDLTIPGGAGALVSSPTELARFVEALFEGRLVSQASLNQMKTMKDGMGMGMFQVPFNEKRGYGYNGLIDGFASNVFYFPESNLTIAYCSNGVVYPVNDILVGTLAIYFNMLYTMPVFHPTPQLPPTEVELNRYLGRYTSTELPLKITIYRDNLQLMAQAAGQTAFPLQPSDKAEFTFDPSGIVITFDTEKKEMILKQGGGTFTFTRQE
jgi:D-alanyl-D-alanine carboxypeptidase